MQRRFAFRLRLPGGKAQIILALLLLGADPVKNGKRDYLIVLLQRHAPNTCRGAALEFAPISGGEANGLALPVGEQHVVALRSEELRDGKECVRTCKYRWLPSHSKIKTKKIADN